MTNVVSLLRVRASVRASRFTATIGIGAQTEPTNAAHFMTIQG